MSLTYLLASLPFLTLGNPPPLQPEDLLARALPHLSPAEAEILRDLLSTGGQRANHPFALAWRSLDTQMRNAIVLVRAQRLKRLPDPFLRPVEGTVRLDIRAAVEEAFQAPNPMERERRFDRARWRLLDELAGPDPFTLESLFAYALKLRLVVRWAALRPDVGEAVLDREVEHLLQSTPLTRLSGTSA
jgi:hypothetical protein